MPSSNVNDTPLSNLYFNHFTSFLVSDDKKLYPRISILQKNELLKSYIISTTFVGHRYSAGIHYIYYVSKTEKGEIPIHGLSEEELIRWN